MDTENVEVEQDADNPNIGVNYDVEPCNCDVGVCFLHSQQEALR